jgi:hypothetical protein
MHPEIEQFKNWLTCQYPTSSTRVHYASDLVLFFAWAMKSPAEINVNVVDNFIAHCRQIGHAPATINRRLAALSTYSVAARLALGYLDKLYWAIDPETDLEQVRHYIAGRYPSFSTRREYEKALRRVHMVSPPSTRVLPG